jgi:hypothetical protein
MSEPKCPICFGTNLSIERRPDGDAQCMDCNWLDKYELCFESKEQTAQLIERLAEAEKALEFYADDLNWGSREYEIVDIEIDESDLSDFCGSISGGKRARDYFEKWHTGEKGK